MWSGLVGLRDLLAGACIGPLGRAVPNPSSTWIVDEPGVGARALFQAFGEGTAFSIAPVTGTAARSGRCLSLLAVASGGPDARHARPHKSAGRSHNGTWDSASPATSWHSLTARNSPDEPPAEAVAWLTSRFHEQYLVIIEGGRPPCGKDERSEE